MNRRFLFLWRAVCVAGLATEPAALRAEEAPLTVTSPRVEVNLIGSVGQDADFVKLTEEWLGANRVAYVSHSLPSLELGDITQARAAGPPVRIWVVAPEPALLRIYLAEPQAQRYLVRDVGLPNGLDELGRERSAQVILSSALAFMERRIASSLGEVERAFREQSTAHAPTAPSIPPPAAPPRTKVVPVQPPGPRPSYGLGIAYAASYAREPLQGPGALVFVEVPSASASLGGTLRGHYRWQQPIETARMRISEIGFPLSLSGGVRWSFHRDWRVRLELGAGMDLVRINPEQPRDSQIQPRAARWDARSFALGLLGVAWRTGQLEVGLLTRWELYPVATRYAVETKTGPAAEFRRDRLQPGLVLELIWLSRSPH